MPRQTWKLSLAASCLALLWACTDSEPEGPFWTPDVLLASGSEQLRDLLDQRGLIHAHSVYSHDACDGEPRIDGEPDQSCLEDFRRGLCQSKHDFVMLTDHRDSFSDTDFPDALLFDAQRGDQLVSRNSEPVASWAACPDGSRALILAGAESGTMPVGLERHAGDRQQRSAIYGDQTAESIEALRANGAVVLVSHTESWSAESLIELPLDGFEMFNIHANMFLFLGEALELVFRVTDGDPTLPHANVAVLPILAEDERYLERWAAVLAAGKKRVTTMGTDCHRNTFKAEMSDGERVDSYRRMMSWFSNHLLLRPEPDLTWDDRHLKEALRSGRLYGSFDLLGYPKGFDFHAEAQDGTHEMGGEVTAASNPELILRRPEIRDLDPEAPAPEIITRILRATESGWEEVARGDSHLSASAAVPGAYRAEVRMVPNHLSSFLGGDRAPILAKDYVWIYSNPIYVR